MSFHFQKQFKYKGLEKLFTAYQRRLQYGYLSLFVLLQLALGTTYCLILVTMVRVTGRRGKLPSVITSSARFSRGVCRRGGQHLYLRG